MLRAISEIVAGSDVQAAALLSSADADELAVAALDRIEATTPLEREILHLVAALALDRG